MSSREGNRVGRRLGRLLLIGIGSLSSFTATAQLAPTGEHYVGRTTDAGYEGAVSGAGVYRTSVPLDLAPEHGGIPVPVRVVYTGGNGGAAGVGWDVPMSFIQVRSTLAGRRPIATPGVAPVAPERVSLTLNGVRTDLVLNGTNYLPRDGAPVLKVVKQDANTWVAYDGAARTYTFSTSLSGTAREAESELAAAGLFPLTDVTGPGGSKMRLSYNYLPGNEAVFGLDLRAVAYNPHPTFGGGVEEEMCYKNHIGLNYESSPATGLSLMNGRFLAHLQKLTAISVYADPDCVSPGKELRRYQFTYQDGGDVDTTLPRLHSVTMTGREGTPEAATALPIATYSYASAKRDGAVLYMPTQTLPAENLSVSGSAFNSTAPTVPLGGTAYFSSGQLVDRNGDGLADFSGLAEAPPGARVDFRLATNRPPDSIHALSAPRYGEGSLSSSTDTTWRQTIDFNGDGRLDVVDAMEVQHAWVVYLNVPSGSDPSHASWTRRVFNTDALNAQLRAEAGWTDTNYTPVAQRFSQRSGTDNTSTRWKLLDVNGDGYPDVVFISTFKVRALLNVIGPQLLSADVSTSNRPFSSAVDYVTADTCGVDNWQASSVGSPTQLQLCSLADVNGDGIVDRINGTRVSLGVAKSTTHGALTDYFSGVLFDLPERPSYLNTHVAGCSGPHLPGTLAGSGQEQGGLRDINGDGVADFVRRNGSALEVAFGNGMGFTAFVAVNGIAAPLISSESETCSGDFSRSSAGLADLNGDGKPDFFLGTGISELRGSSGNRADIGRLVEIDNGYGARIFISYASAKADRSTLHQLPYPEIVTAAVLTVGQHGFGGSLAEIRYGYGDAEQYFDSYTDRFAFPGYRVSSQLHPGDTSAKPSATITTTYGLPGSTNGSTQNARFGRYLKAGRTRDFYQLTDNGNVTLGSDPYALLQNFRLDSGQGLGSADARIISRTHHVWDTKMLAAPAASSDPQFCWDLVSPYDFEASKSFDIGQGSDPSHANFDICLARGFVFDREVTTVRTALKPAGAPGDWATANVSTRLEVLDIDDLGRVIRKKDWNDVNVADDDVCMETLYAVPTTTTNAKPVFGPATRKLTDCGTTAVTLASESWEYDTLPVGNISNGFVTGHSTERRNAAGQLLATVRDFDAVWDTATGNPTSVVTRRDGAGDDGASRTKTMTYDPFGLVMKTLQTDAVNGDGTSLPSLSVVRTLDPITMNVLTSTDANGTVGALTYDGFDRVVLAEITPPGGALGVLSSMSYLGFSAGDAEGRRIVRKEFTDPVAPANVATAPGRTSTTFLDELARTRKSEIALGADYADQKLIVGARVYDGYGRVQFEADPFPSTQTPRLAYGTTRHFSADGTPSCFIRGNGLQSLTNVTDESHEVYPTCLRHSFENHQEVHEVRDAMALQPGSEARGAMQRTFSTAIGNVTSMEKWEDAGQQLTTRKEHSSFAYDRLGRRTTMSRFLNANDAADTALTTVWKYDSLGQVLELDEPDSAPQMRTYSKWGELTEVSWCDTKTSPCTNRRSLSRFDALGRLVHSESKDADVVDAATVNDYAYDQPATFISRMQPTYVLGRLASASSPESRTVFSYDAMGRIDAQGFDDRHNANYLQKHTYHGDGSLARFDLLLPDTGYNTERVDYTYDSASRLRSARYTDGTVTQDLFRATGSTDIDAFGRIRQANYGAALFTAAYSDTGRRLPSNLKVSSPGGAHSRQISFVAPAGTTSAFDALGRERSRQEIKDDASGAPIIAFDYSILGELRSATRKVESTLLAGSAFQYDSFGNVLQHAYTGAPIPGTVGMSYQTVDRDRICSISYDGSTPAATCNVKYDGAGAIVEMPTRSKGKRTISYYADGSVKAIVDGILNVAVFKYDAFGGVERLGLTSNSSPDTRNDWHFGAYIDKHDEVVNGVVTSVITRKIPAAGVLATRHGAAGNWTFAFGELRGNRFFTDQNGAFVQDVDYQPYGEVIAAGSTGAQPGSPNYTSAQWNGGDALAALGISQLGARMYDPVIGRFLSRDPLFGSARATKANPYAFAGNDPVNSADPTGLMESTGPKQPPTSYTPWESPFPPEWKSEGGGGGGGSESIIGNEVIIIVDKKPWDFGSDGSLDYPARRGDGRGGDGGRRGGTGSGAHGFPITFDALVSKMRTIAGLRPGENFSRAAYERRINELKAMLEPLVDRRWKNLSLLINAARNPLIKTTHQAELERLAREKQTIDVLDDMLDQVKEDYEYYKIYETWIAPVQSLPPGFLQDTLGNAMWGIPGMFVTF